ncbi:hypothetical protein MPSEU_000590700 [Mayamaea pseudoterrestris]|nr:hypothetical protein MPSEU_000590700 [Mayamaea pseudoterrestris]
MDVEAFERIVRPYLPHSFSNQHLLLLQICFGNVKPNPRYVQPLNDHLDAGDMDRLYYMVQLEFAESLEKEKTGSDTTTIDVDDLRPYDVCLMCATINQPRKNIAVVLPRKNTRKLIWYDGGKDLFELDALFPKWKVASLSGTVRVLEALKAPVDALSHWAMRREMLQPVERNLQVLKSVNEDSIQHLNVSQRQAVATVASRNFTEGFFCIQGPPGTGKTTAAVSMICAAAKEDRVLVTAPSNAAVANIALKVFATGVYDSKNLVVYGENCDSSVQFLNPKLRGEKFRNLLCDLDMINDLIAKTEAENQKATLEARKEKARLEFIEWLRLVGSHFSMEELRSLCPISDGDNYGRLMAACLGAASVAFCTLNQAGSGLLRKYYEAATLMLDEAGQTPESDFYIATSFPGVKRIIVIGDPCQLPATVISPDCATAGFGISWLEKVQRLYPESVHLLDTQYRMDPLILKFPNRAFYKNRIQSGDNVFGREPRVDQPFLFVDTQRRGKEERDFYSHRNPYEAVVIKSLIKTDPDILRILDSHINPRIIVIAPYRSQVKLLKESLEGLGLPIEVATVDSFQGQEGEIVILSTVRTRQIGFVDSEQRLCVGLTRGKLLVRVVGERRFFLSLGPRSTLRKLCEFVEGEGLLHVSKVRAQPWSAPNWDQVTIWKPVMNARFCDCVQKMRECDKNIALNTVLAISVPDCGALGSTIPSRTGPNWYISYLTKYRRSLNVVWLAKEGQDKPIIEAHFVGSPDECRQFIQRHPEIPAAVFACMVRQNLSGLLMTSRVDLSDVTESPILSHPLSSWPLNNETQKAICSNAILPAGAVQLDALQERVSLSSPPLLVESRSGTGKTLVLLQHVAYHSNLDTVDERSPCFITVSPRLCKRLTQEYRDMQNASNQSLPDVCFLTYHDVLDFLSRQYAKDLHPSNLCTFVRFVNTRTSHDALPVEMQLVENEIGGVIMGSLDSVVQLMPLTREQYSLTKRSNIESKSSDGRSRRNSVYDIFLRYKIWKRDNGFFDNHDLVLRLLVWLRSKLTVDNNFELFSSAYLDEVQDLSYASIYLLCSLAGRTSTAPHWVCAGDPAQMITPGCSFSFEGLKEVLGTIRPDVKLKNVAHLLVNYRTTKDVLELANAILKVAKRDFPGAIGFAQPEVAQKDLHYKVLLCCMESAFLEPIKLGAQQALIFSGSDLLEQRARDWTGNHPFVLSSLDSKGLEFDDVIVVFDLDRKAWNTSAGHAQSLRMLRELYVAITRGRRRVVILVPSRDSAMRTFFDSLEYKFQTTGADTILRGFDTDTHPEEWKQQGLDMFEDGQYELAHRCFETSGDLGWAQYALFRLLISQGRDGAESACGYAMDEFCSRREFEQVVNLAQLAQRHSCWPSSKADVIIKSLDNQASVMDRRMYIILALKCGHWTNLTIEDVKSPSMSDIWSKERDNVKLRCILKGSSTKDLEDVTFVLPAIVGDYHRDAKCLDKAVDCYLRAHDFDCATSILWSQLAELEQRGVLTKKSATVLERCVNMCLAQAIPTKHDKIRSFLRIVKLLQESQVKGSPSEELLNFAPESAKHLSRSVILWSFDFAKADRLLLYHFGNEQFLLEVTGVLVTRFAGQLIEAVRWFLSHGDAPHAAQFARKRLEEWTKSETLALVLMLKPSLTDGWEWLFDKIYTTRLTTWCLLIVTGSQKWNPANKTNFMKGLERRAKAITLGSAAMQKSKRKGKVDANAPFTRLDNWCKTFLQHTLKQDGQNNAAIMCHLESLSDNNLESILIQMRLFTDIIELAEPSFNNGEPRPAFRGLFEESNRRRLGCRLIIGATNSETAGSKWLLRAFLSYQIALHVPNDVSLELLEVSLDAGVIELPVWVQTSDNTKTCHLHELVTRLGRQGAYHAISPEKYLSLMRLAFDNRLPDLAVALHEHYRFDFIPVTKAMSFLRQSLALELADLALDFTWRTIRSHSSAEANLPAVLELWSNYATEDLRKNTFGPDYTEQSLAETLVVLNPLAKDVHPSLFLIFNYGPAIARCMRLGVATAAFAATLQRSVEFHGQLRSVLAKHFVAETDLPATGKANITKGKPKAKAQKGKGKGKSDEKVAAMNPKAPVFTPSEGTFSAAKAPANGNGNGISKKNKKKNKKKGKNK